MQFNGCTVGNAEACNLDIVEELKVEERNLFTIFPISTIMQYGNKRKEAMMCVKGNSPYKSEHYCYFT